MAGEITFVAGLQYASEVRPRVPVIVIHAPLPKAALIQIDKTVSVYGSSVNDLD